MNEVHTAKYKTLYNRLTGGIPFAASIAIARITALAEAAGRRSGGQVKL